VPDSMIVRTYVACDNHQNDQIASVTRAKGYEPQGARLVLVDFGQLGAERPSPCCPASPKLLPTSVLVLPNGNVLSHGLPWARVHSRQFLRRHVQLLVGMQVFAGMYSCVSKL
jgi:hypothetical protein